eukprot:TRINITY_DN6259_c0_g1_i1.p1 TRINITY_DN6259_c0_g1~~TRINITY_DN6259_c0_g1_i1.p1  ORF type:complete len:478 (+),score=64.68 TRINITY_DN6259_c0_g1_i1:206-1435(+)
MAASSDILLRNIAIHQFYVHREYLERPSSLTSRLVEIIFQNIPHCEKFENQELIRSAVEIIQALSESNTWKKEVISSNGIFALRLLYQHCSTISELQILSKLACGAEGKLCRRASISLLMPNTKSKDKPFRFLETLPNGEKLREAVLDYDDLKFGSEIGSGGFSKVFRGTFRFHQPVAIKTFSGFFGYEKTLADFLKEVQFIRDLGHHENIIKMLGISFKFESSNDLRVSENGGLMAVFELCPYGNLSNFLEKLNGKMFFAEQFKMCLECSRGLQHLHKQGKMHRDLKSLNFLVAENSIKLADFGQSRKVDRVMTTGMGTFAYVAPEARNSTHYDYSADIFSLGIVFWEIVTQKSIVKEPCDPQGRPAIPFQVNARLTLLITNMWHVDPRKRPSISEVIRTLEELRAAS